MNIGMTRTTSSFMVELWACREGLRLACSLGIFHLVLKMNSMLVVQLVQARSASTGIALSLFADINSLLNSFSHCVIRHPLREGNYTANYMPFLGHSMALGPTLFTTPPAGLSLILHGDIMGTAFLRT
ncbi:hypothetical protein SLE2022_316150 [Rubroshorea leprosula]